ncbi:MAG: hypothetical protein KJN90_13190 [Gammaproteobacteria bacterium]|nr:hypothetical protein [Gammaproteobacteria bacterium]
MKTNKALLGFTLFASLTLFQSGNVYAGTFIQNVCWLVTDVGEEPRADDDIVNVELLTSAADTIVSLVM